jgi:KaiC/GvpD/RAD55 family RecA-like ATPase
MADLSVEGKVGEVSGGVRRLVANEASHRKAVLDGFAAAQAEADRLVQAIVDARPTGPEPERTADAVARNATLADVRRLDVDRSWPWHGWLPRGAMTALASDPGVGKTLLAMTLAKAFWSASPWPDGQAASFPAGTKTLWVAGDHHFGQLVEVAAAYGLPPESILLNGSPDEPTGRLFLDDAKAVEALHAGILAEAPGLVIIDTVGMTTDRNLGRPEEARQYFEPLMKIAGMTRTSFLLLTHLSRESQALGRRIVGACRVVWKLTQPDPEGQPDRRKLWVDKSYALKPQALGVTIADAGCTFDSQPPEEVAKDQGGRPGKVALCMLWLKGLLDVKPMLIKEIRPEAEAVGFSAGLLYKAAESLGVEEYIVDKRKWWRLPTAS